MTYMTFLDIVDRIEPDGSHFAVTFVKKPGNFRVPPQPEDMSQALRQSQRSGCKVAVTYESQSFNVVDALVE